MNLIYRASKFMAWCFCRVWLRARGVDVGNLPPEGGVLLASNHASHLDPMLLGVFLQRQVCFVARDSLGRIPLAGCWMRKVGVVFIDRKSPGREAMGKVIETLVEGRVVCMFPEGTRSPDGRLHAFQKGLLLLLKKSDATVVPVGIRGSFSALPRGTYLPRPRRCSVHYGRPRPASEVLAPGGLEALRHDVAELSGMEIT